MNTRLLRTAAVLGVLLCAACVLPRGAAAQTRADTAAVLLQAAEELRLRGEPDAARALLTLIAERYAGTAAAAQVEAMRALLRGAPAVERSGRTELLVWSATYGAWLGIAVPLMLDSDSEEAYGLGLLLGAPAGFMAARRYTASAMPTEGQARAITFGGSWGTYQGLGWAEVFDIGVSRVDEFGFEETDGSARITAAVIGGLAGIGAGALLARKPISAGTAAATTLGGLWGTWFGFALSYIGGLEDDALLGSTLTAGNVALAATALAAPSWQLSESRARLISVGGLIGALGGAGLVLITQPDDDKVALAIPTVTSALGLLFAANRTRAADASGSGPNGGQDAGGAAPRGALLNISAGRLTIDTPAAALRLVRQHSALTPVVHVPLLQARF